jgi:hypothetical protein
MPARARHERAPARGRSPRPRGRRRRQARRLDRGRHRARLPWQPSRTRTHPATALTPPAPDEPRPARPPCLQGDSRAPRLGFAAQTAISRSGRARRRTPRSPRWADDTPTSSRSRRPPAGAGNYRERPISRARLRRSPRPDALASPDDERGDDDQDDGNISHAAHPRCVFDGDGFRPCPSQPVIFPACRDHTEACTAMLHSRLTCAP